MIGTLKHNKNSFNTVNSIQGKHRENSQEFVLLRFELRMSSLHGKQKWRISESNVIQGSALESLHLT